MRFRREGKSLKNSPSGIHNNHRGDWLKTVKYEVSYGEKAGRLELFIRWFWSIPSYIVLVLLAIVFCIATFLQFFHVLLLGKRNKMLYDWALMYVAYHTKWMSYLMLLTEERNPLLPE